MTKLPVLLYIQIDTGALTPNALRRINYYAAARLVRQAKEMAWLEWRLVGGPRHSGPVHVSIIVRRKRLLDGDNATRSVKAIRDALFGAQREVIPGSRGKNGKPRWRMIPGLLAPDDSDKWIKSYEVNQEVGEPLVAVLVRPA